ncbi:hypothetical protein ACN38_g11097, partial [Penicillium nordicum]
HLHF